jgi:hypothetical protein
MRSTLVIVLAVSAVIAALTLKAARYAGAGTVSAEDAAVEVTGIMAADGWVAEAAPLERQGGLYTRLSFTRPDCRERVTVAVLGGNAEGAGLAALELGRHVAFVQGSRIVPAPSGFERQRTLLLHGLGRLAGHGGKPPLPVLAIAPASHSCAWPWPG